MWEFLKWLFRRPEEPDTDRIPDWTDPIPLDFPPPTTRPSLEDDE